MITKEIRKSILQMVYRSKSSHIGSCLSIVEILYVLYFKVMRIDPAHPDNESRDKFILSKGHASAALYATLAEKGFFEKQLLERFYVDYGLLPGHVDMKAVPGIEASSGSLGHGLSIGIGMAIANKLSNNPGHIYVLLGDGECNEGSIWEGVMIAPMLKLDNLTVIIDLNKLQGYGRSDEIINQSNIIERWKAFGWDTYDIDGHDTEEIEVALKYYHSMPKVIVANTIKGKGISFMENKLEWHYKSPNTEEYQKALAELGD